MNNINQKGGLSQKEQALQIIRNFYRNKNTMIKNPVNQVYIENWINLQVIYDSNTGILSNNPTYSNVGPHVPFPAPITIDESDFFAGFNTDLQQLIEQTIYFETEAVKIGRDSNIIYNIHFNEQLLIVDGVNIIHNLDVLLGFLILILSDSTTKIYKRHVLLLINELILKKANPNAPKDYKNMKVVLENILPFIIKQIKYTNNVNIIIIQHDSEELQPGQKIVTHSRTLEVVKPDASTNFHKHIQTIQLAKLGETGISQPVLLPPHNVKPDRLGGLTHFTPSVVAESPRVSATREISSGVIPSTWQNVTPSYSSKPDHRYSYEGDDAVVTGLALFNTKVIVHPRFALFSGDGYKYVKDRTILDQRACLLQNESENPLEPIYFGMIDKTNLNELDKKIFKHSSLRLKVLKTYLENLPPLLAWGAPDPATIPIIQYVDSLIRTADLAAGLKPMDIDIDIQPPQAWGQAWVMPPAPAWVAQPPAPLAQQPNLIGQWQSKYLKYKQKYLLLKSQIN